MAKNKKKIDVAFVPEIMKCIQLLDKTFFCFKNIQEAISEIVADEEGELFADELLSMENKLKTAIINHDYQV